MQPARLPNSHALRAGPRRPTAGGGIWQQTKKDGGTICSSGARDGCSTQADRTQQLHCTQSSQFTPKLQLPVLPIILIDDPPHQCPPLTSDTPDPSTARLHRDSIPETPSTRHHDPPPPLPRQSLPFLPFLSGITQPLHHQPAEAACFASVQWSSGMIRASGSLLSRYLFYGCSYCARSGVRIPVEPFFLSAQHT